MTVYEQAVHDTRHYLMDLFERVSAQVYAPFANWTDLQKLVLILGLIVFLGYLAARPPRTRRRYAAAQTNHGLVMLCVVVVGSFTAGLVFITP